MYNISYNFATEDSSLLEYDAVQIGIKVPTLWRSLLMSSETS
jgi:hypothetical protein